MINTRRRLQVLANLFVGVLGAVEKPTVARIFSASLAQSAQFTVQHPRGDEMRDRAGLLTLFVGVIFFVEVSLFTALTGSSFGQRILGIRVESLTTGRLDPLRSVVRTGLLCLVVPPLIFDRDQRGLHDKAANSVAVRMGHAS